MPEEENSDIQSDEETQEPAPADSAEGVVDAAAAAGGDLVDVVDRPPAEERPAEPAETVVQAEQPAKVALSRAERERYERQRRRFAACGRCGYFVADCLLLVGEGAFQSALLSVRDNWITLDGDETFRRLLVNAYGVELDIDYDYFDGSCPECRRRFVFTENEDGLTQLKIQP